MDTRQLGTTDLQITPIGFGAWAIGGPDYAFGWGPQDDDDSVGGDSPGHRRRHQLDRHGPGLRARPVRAGRGPGPQVAGPVAPAVRLHEVLARVGRARARSPTRSRRRRCARKWRTASGGWRPTSSTSTRSTGRSRGGSTGRRPTSRRAGARWPPCRRRARCGTSPCRTSTSPRWTRIEAHRAHRQPAAALLDAAPRHRGELLPYCLAHRIGVIVYSPMAAGILSGAMTRERAPSLPPNDWRSKNPEYQEPRLVAQPGAGRGAARRSARATATSPGAVAIAWTLRQPAVTGAIVGFRSATQVDGILAAAVACGSTAEEIAGDRRRHRRRTDRAAQHGPVRVERPELLGQPAVEGWREGQAERSPRTAPASTSTT